MMADKELQEKSAFFSEQELLDISDDEHGFPDENMLRAERALADTQAMPPPTMPKLVRQRSSFLGPTPKERQAKFEEHATKQRLKTRPEGSNLTRSATAPEANVSKSFPSARKRSNGSSSPQRQNPRSGLRHSTSLPDLVAAAQTEDVEIPFYKRMGVIPRELKNGKNVKPAENIRLEPEPKQLLKGKIVYFFPNDDISLARRHRIHKIIQLGAAWVNRWRNDITHIMVDDANYSYTQVLRHLNKAGLPRKVTLVKFDPYIPQCIQLGLLLEATAGRFLLKGAPRPTSFSAALKASSSPASQSSLQVKPSRRELAAKGSPRTDSVPDQDGWLPSGDPGEPPSSPFSDIVKDSFIQPSSDPVDSYNDELTRAIEQTKAISHLPIDEEDTDAASTAADTAAEDSSSDNESQEAPKPARKQTSFGFSPSSRGKTKGFDNYNFQCMNPGANNNSQNPNARTIEVLDQMCKYYDQMQDQWRTLAYRKGIATLRKQDTKISTKEEALALPFIGSRLAEKIEEIVLTNRLRKLDNTRDDPLDQVLRLFLGVYGAGLSQANKWIQAGYRSLEDLVTKARLTESQKIGIQHYDDFAARIPRAEVEQHGNFVRGTLNRIDKGFQVTVMGSYRRGAKDSGDIDLIITKSATSLAVMRNIVFEQLVPMLFSLNFFKVALATSHRTNDGTKWHGASCLPGSKVWRRLDLLLVPEEEMGAALLYFTGNDIFNRSMRLLASKKGMRLNQRGLYRDVVRGRNREKLNEGTLVEGRDEKKIFEILGVPWRKPTERIC
ncbi:hypothetical protein BDV96DRAFT_539101 [Lophiotrema nucula]|uniref:DNA-directed DNA polymerase n=1 Tax=Lophiotrema nucula TaxID=690887 RepID=A0A6A5ZRA5_9PLEO|nr:hypothetical protein BDV96DRAFT_539101 [Lophiotrema nucula]